MKIEIITVAGANTDRIKVSGKVITINSTDFNMENLTERIDPSDPKYDAQRFWKDESDIVHGILKIGKYHRGPWFDNRMMAFFGFNNGDITIKEFTAYVKWHNEIQSVLDEYSDRIRELKASKDVKKLDVIYVERDTKYKTINKRWLKS
jgi:hypothetical protein